jgi:phage terminase Nu1 subunit (DNA packaging protein)
LEEKERTMIFMARSTKSYEERMLQLEKKEQESLEKAKQYAAQKRELKKRQKDVETKKRTHRLCQIGGAVESVLGSAIEEDDIPKLIGFLKRQEANGKFFSKAMQKEPVANTEEV